MMLTEFCAETKNYFLAHDAYDVHTGLFLVADRQIEPLDFLESGQYFRIVGSRFCDGVWRYGVDTLPRNEAFNGTIWAMSVPPAVESLCTEIENWITANADTLNSPFTSESFGGYSYSKAMGNSASGKQGGYSWKDHFASRLTPYRRIKPL